jgi:hypothetical protein
MRAVEARMLFQQIASDLSLANLAPPTRPSPSEVDWDIWPDLEGWVLQTSADLASGDVGRYLALMPRQRRALATLSARVERLAAVSPAAAVIEACRQVEIELESQLRSSTDRVMSMRAGSLKGLAVTNHLLSPSESEALQGLLQLRSRAVHSPNTEIDREQAISAGRLAQQLISAIRLASGRGESADQIPSDPAES